jgi:hypothetical protein
MRKACRQTLWLVSLTYVIYGYFVGGYVNNPMTNSAADLTLALVDDHRLQIDPYAGNSSDLATRDGHLYSGFAPGLSYILVPVYVAIKPIIALIPARLVVRTDALLFEGAHQTSPQLTRSEARTVVLLLVLAGTLCIAIPMTIASGLLLMKLCRRFFRDLGHRDLIGLLFVFLFATLAFSFATNLTHTSVAALLVWLGVGSGVFLEERSARRICLVAIGGAFGLAPVVDYQAALFSLYGIVFVLFLQSPKGRLRAMITLGLGATPPVLCSLAYHAAAFGSAFTNAYRFRVRTPDRGIFSFAHLGASLPNSQKIYVGLIGPFSGILFYHPLLVVGLCASGYFAVTEKDSRRRAFWILAAATILTNVGIYCSYPLSVGPGSLPTFAIRYTIYSAPFVVIGLAGLLAKTKEENRDRLRTGLLFLSVLNAIPVWAFAFYGIPVFPSRDYWRLLLEIGPGSYTLTKLHQGHLLAGPISGWAGFVLVLGLLFAWWGVASALFSQEVRAGGIPKP